MISARQSGVYNSTRPRGWKDNTSADNTFCILIAWKQVLFQMQTMNQMQSVEKRCRSGGINDELLAISPVCVCVCVLGEGKVFLIVCRVRGSGSDITHDQIRVVFGELLAGHLSQLSIPLLGFGPLCVDD